MNERIGLLPAAGRGSRLGPIPCSKEIMPLGFQSPTSKEADWIPVTTIERHLQAFSLAQVQQVGIIVGNTKWDIVSYLGNGKRLNLSLAYFFQESLNGMPFALDLTYSWIKEATILFSMPDTLITPIDAMTKLVEHHETTKADVTLGLFETDTPKKFGMVELNDKREIIGFVDKPEKTDLSLMWGCAAWSPVFTRFMHQYLKDINLPGKEIVLSDLFLAALDKGLTFEPLLVEGQYHDIGTPDSFQAAVYDLARQQIAN
ncbi:nucleotidyltransferase family protein [Candidatus Leptofilum sp.]|uniref:nucleotidyltransferase family protein n=1 Tax=Candidatus Leptofilum sp. TaxID=3241576 RepID=UPI003B5CCC1E